MYGSTMDALDNCTKLSRRILHIDDYALRGCRAAVDDYRSRHGIVTEMGVIDWSGSIGRRRKAVTRERVFSGCRIGQRGQSSLPPGGAEVEVSY